MIVLDASAAIEWLFQSPAGIKVDRRIFSTSETLHVPHLLDIEVAQVLRRYVRDKTIAVYVALAEALDAPLLTCDGKIASASGHSANVEVV